MQRSNARRYRPELYGVCYGNGSTHNAGIVASFNVKGIGADPGKMIDPESGLRRDHDLRNELQIVRNARICVLNAGCANALGLDSESSENTENC